ncbi:hypothetical protein GLOIN_2v1791831 [Rhizophagus irregularis DAOM 181602=DAOM 197198]|nr:hypothetical protein GLOIN_2v1791831 [Rhizophagus irregularis DAOM 181602=DAOM 197198]
MLIAVHTAPHHSWTNPAERIMSILNLGLQNVAIMRNTMSDESEALFDKADTLDEIHVQSLLHSRSERLVLKDQYFKCYNAASEYDINGLFQSISKVDPLLTHNDTTQAQLTRHNELVSFMKTHCHERAYSFQIKKCQDVSCNICTPIRLPQTVFDSLHFLPDPVPALDNPDHYTSFQAVYGKQTSEEFRPSLQLNQANAEPVPKSVFASGKIRDYIMCCDCGKRRCVYSDKALSQDEIQDFNRKSGNSNICYHCDTDSDFVDPPDSIRTKYKIIYPLCQRCQDKGKEFNARMEVKVNGSNSK